MLPHPSLSKILGVLPFVILIVWTANLAKVGGAIVFDIPQAEVETTHYASTPARVVPLTPETLDDVVDEAPFSIVTFCST